MTENVEEIQETRKRTKKMTNINNRTLDEESRHYLQLQKLNMLEDNEEMYKQEEY